MRISTFWRLWERKSSRPMYQIDPSVFPGNLGERYTTEEKDFSSVASFLICFFTFSRLAWAVGEREKERK